MRISIRAKLVIAISLLMIVVFTAAANLFINEKKAELSHDIYVNSLAFAKLTAADVAYDYELYLAQSGFVYFNREISGLFEKNQDVSRIIVADFEGQILYDSAEEVDKQYQGDARFADQNLVSQIQSENIAVETLDGRVVYLKNDQFVDANEKSAEALEEDVRVAHFVVPGDEQYSVIYELSYQNLDQRITNMMRRIVYLALFAVMLGIALSFGMSTQVTRPVKKLVEGAGNIAKGDLKTRVNITTRDEMSFLGEAFNKMAEDLEKSIKDKLYKQRVERELEIATQIQDQIIPDKVPKTDGLDIASGLVAAGEIGGDMYDFIPLANGRLLMYLGDVTGHGVPAGIVSSISNALFYAYANELDLKKLIASVNKVLKVKTMPTMFMTVCLMEWDQIRKSFKYLNAGHEPIMHYVASEKRVDIRKDDGIALGMIDDIYAKSQVVEMGLKEEDVLLIYSDGLSEAWKNDNENYGTERLKAAMEKFGALETAEQIKDAILNDVKEFMGDYEQKDDITLMVIKRTA